MKIDIINKSERRYKINAEKIIIKIVEKIPEEYLCGLNKIYIFDYRKSEMTSINYVKSSKKINKPFIEVFMDNPDFHGYLFFPILSFNILFILAINQHINYYANKYLNKSRAYSYPISSINYDWMYLERWNFLIIIFKNANYFISRIFFLRKAFLNFSKKIFRL